MATELELKLMVHPAHLASACEYFDALCADRNGSQAEPTLNLMNGYFDTPDGTLMKAGVALRIRAVNQRYIQTLKTKGSSRIGLHERGEWEWEVSKDALDLTLLSKEMLPPALHDFRWASELIEVFRTDFERKVWSVREGETDMEVVRDKGTVSSPHGDDQISELELELKNGTADQLYEVALLLSHHVPVQVSTVSKAQKGVRLKNRKIELPEKPPAKAPVRTLSEYWYEVWLAYWEALFFLDDEALVQPVRNAITQLRHCLPGQFSPALQDLENDIAHLVQTSSSGLLVALGGLMSVGENMLLIGRWLNQQEGQ